MLGTDKQRRRQRPKPFKNKLSELDHYLNMCGHQPHKRTLQHSNGFLESGHSLLSRVSLLNRHNKSPLFRSTTPIRCRQNSDQIAVPKGIGQNSLDVDQIQKDELHNTQPKRFTVGPHSNTRSSSICRDIQQNRNKVKNILFQTHHTPIYGLNHSYRYLRRSGLQSKPFFNTSNKSDEKSFTAKSHEKQHNRNNTNVIKNMLPICNPIKIGQQTTTSGLLGNFDDSCRDKASWRFRSSKHVNTTKNVKNSPFAAVDFYAEDATINLSVETVAVAQQNCEGNKIVCYGESFQGRRSYNEDRWVVKSKLQASQKTGKRENSQLVTFKKRLDAYLAHTPSTKQQYEPDEPVEQEITEYQLPSSADNSHPEPYILFGVYDGHGGSSCAEYVKGNVFKFIETNKNMPANPLTALKQVCCKLEEDFLSLCEKKVNLQRSGSCAVSVLYYPTCNKLFIASIGDCRAYLLLRDQIIELTRDHKPDQKEEKLRIIRHGGKLYKEEAINKSVVGLLDKNKIKIFSQTRIMPGSLNVSRTLGDIESKVKRYGGLPGVVIAEPDLIEYTIKNPNESNTLILCSDGLVQGLQNYQIFSIYEKLVGRSKSGIFNPEQLVKSLIQEASIKSCDNITVVAAIL